ncbi:hypothetical protein PDJ85_22320 [Bacillus cereus group sp. TH260-2LC]|uniref:hypothetical protein n=2 Tax=Bacteria TaxID=2 RepID=UPI0022DEA5C1|nr:MULTISPECIES: hypothetical protein [Bacillus cereus group]MBL3848402.1 hypothetical protein [Bacillus cereus]MDA1531082.1 hypothetical protein [Bacillus cereus group sp. TH260-2LC]
MENQIEVNDFYSRWSYDEFRIKQPHVKTDGLWEKDNFYFIKCKDSTIKPLNDIELTLEEHFNKKIKAAGAPVRLVEVVPEGAIRVQDRSLEEIVQLTGVPLNQNQFDTQLSILLPSDFPTYKFYFQQGVGWCLEVERKLTSEEKQIFHSSLQTLQGYSNTSNLKIIEKKIDESTIQKGKSNEKLEILSLRSFQLNSTSRLKKLWELDEELWIDHRMPVLTKDEISEENLPTKWNHMKSSCLIDTSVFEAHDIRNYLTMYQNIILVSPLNFAHEKVLSSLGVSQSELIELVKLGRIKIIFPHSIERYNLRFLEELSDTEPSNLMFSRQLALRTIMDTKKRNPLLYPALEISEKQQLLASFLYLADRVNDSKTESWIKAMSQELSRIWLNADVMIATRGAMGTAPMGFATIIAAIIKSQTGKDYTFELLTSSMAVEWAGAMNSTICPIGEQSNRKNSEILANIYSGVSQDWQMNFMSSPNIATEGILTIAKDVPVLELAQSFSGADIERFQSMIQSITQHHQPEEMNQVIAAFNQSVKAFERKKNRTETWDIKGVIVEGTTTLAGLTLPLAGLLLNGIGKGLEHVGGKSTRVGEFLDKAQASIHRTTPEAILVSRMKGQVKDLL